MLPEKNILRTIEKQKRLIAMMREMLYTNVGKADIRGIYQTKEPLHEIPDDSMLSPLPEDKVWGGEGVYAWFKGSYTVPAELDGKILYAYPKTTYYEGTLWVNERITANFAAKIFAGPHGNHYSKRFTPMEGAKAGEKYEFALETYAWHEVPGTQPFLSERLPTHFYKVDDFDICVRDDELMHLQFAALLNDFKCVEGVVQKRAYAQHHNHNIIPGHVVYLLRSLFYGEGKVADQKNQRHEGSQANFFKPRCPQRDINAKQRKGGHDAGDDPLGHSFPHAGVGFPVVFFHNGIQVCRFLRHAYGCGFLLEQCHTDPPLREKFIGARSAGFSINERLRHLRRSLLFMCAVYSETTVMPFS